MDASTKHGLPPVARQDCRLFILGSLPGDASLAARRYYAHPRNGFWFLLEQTIGEQLVALDYPARLERLMANRIGLWDVVAHAMRKGSLDQAIRDPGHNALAEYFMGFPVLEAVAFNGAAASSAGRKLLVGTGLELLDLPSSSPANTSPLAEKMRQWSQIARYCGG